MLKSPFLSMAFKKKDIMEMITSFANYKLQENLHQNFLEDIKGVVTPKEMLDVCDSASINQKGYRVMYRSITLGLQAK